jgi:hypothetical protein
MLVCAVIQGMSWSRVDTSVDLDRDVGGGVSPDHSVTCDTGLYTLVAHTHADVWGL